mgnify:CR=1 FL=1
MTFFWQNPVPVLLGNPRDPGRDESPHYPFSRRRKLGPGPLGDTNERAAKWDCTCETPYVCVCDGIAEETEVQRRVIRTDPKRKKAYNKMYRQWRKRQRR